eukprot:Gb_07040 [translate_table: standard]
MRIVFFLTNDRILKLVAIELCLPSTVVMQSVRDIYTPLRDVKGNDKTAYVTDFGIARLTCKNSVDSFTSTIAIKGSTGYVAPDVTYLNAEYGFGGKVSTKGDVYSFGIVLLEMMTRQRPIDDMFVEVLNLCKWVRIAFPDRIMEERGGGFPGAEIEPLTEVERHQD